MTALDVRPTTAAAAVPATAEPESGRQLPAGWPIAVVVAGYPLWWAAGLTPVAFPLAAAVLLWDLFRQGRRLKVPPGYGLWLAFLVVVLVSAVMLDVTAPNTIPPSGVSRYSAFALRLINYIAVSVCMLYVGNVSEERLPRVRVMRWIAVLGAWTILLGTAGVVFPNVAFDTLITHILPASVTAVLGDTTAALAQTQPVLGFVAPRPAAPFAFTNAWGNNLSLLLVWLIGLAVVSRPRVRIVIAGLVVLSAVPIVYSLNRGMWIGLGLSLLYVAVRLAGRGKVLAIGVLALIIGVAAIAFVASPLQTIVQERLSHGHSNDTRTSLAGDALTSAKSSPLLGYGSTRETRGSGSSITVGKSASCPKCGNLNIGSTGQWLLLLIAQGFTGVALYAAYFLRTLWAFRHDSSPIGIAGTLVLLLSLFYGFFYSALLMPLALVFLSIGLLWRNAAVRRATGAAPAS